MASNILVLGAGELGTAVLTALAARAPKTTNITVLLRSSTIQSSAPAKIAELQALKALNIALQPGDIATDSLSTLISIFQPYDLVISCLGFASGLGSQVKITTAVLNAGVRRYIPWQFGVDYDIVGRGSAQPVWDEQLDVRDLLRGQKETEWIIVSTGLFMSFLFEPSFGVVDVDAAVARALGAWENEVTVTTPKDIGRLTAEIVFHEPQIKDEVVYVAGETIDYGEVARIVEEVLGRELKKEVWTVEQLKNDLAKHPEDVMSRYRVVFAEGKGVSWHMANTFNERQSLQVQDVESFAKEIFNRRGGQ